MGNVTYLQKAQSMSESFQALIFGVAAILHGITGMGFPMIATSALAFLMPLSQAVAIVAIPSLLMSLLVLCTNNQGSLIDELRYYAQHYRLLAAMSVIGGIIGVQLLLVLPVAWLYVMMAAVTLYYAGHGFLSMTGKIGALTVPTGRLSMAAFGLIAGIVGGATNAMSPILLIFLFSQTDDKNRIAKASNLCYLLGKLVQIFLLQGEYRAFGYGEYALLIILTAVSMLGLFGGIRLRTIISTTVFKLLIFGILLVLALKIGQSGIAQLTA
ncbi:hypothetical protein AO382_1224 [Moraxella catarrhalis]|uniref:Probable membrane transporter protein n=1 Tax=Moraxella catarrhalis TaxID=480 RepID=A0A7Z0UYK6_MORCA|nr:hypothetical protein AO382_1224 [Moraxella catarrhalis]